jgi:hypothetical protein
MTTALRDDYDAPRWGNGPSRDLIWLIWWSSLTLMVSSDRSQV